MANRADLDHLVKLINNSSGRKVTLDKDCVGYRLDTENGRHVSPRLPFGKMYAWLEAFLTGIQFKGRSPCGKYSLTASKEMVN